MLIKNFIILVIAFFLVNSLFAQTSRWRVIWNPNLPTDSVTHYEVYIGSDSNNVNLVGTVNHPETEYRDSLGIGGAGLNQGQIYYYRIKAVNQHGSGPFSNAAYASIPEIRFTQLSLPVSTDTTFSLNQAQFVRDPDFGISQLVWDVQDLVPGDSIQHSLINTNTINFITPNDTTNQDLLEFRVFDADSFYDARSIPILLTKPTFSPVVSGIPDQTINLGQSFTSFDLDDYVTDADHSDSELTWTVNGNDSLTVNINAISHIVTITPVNPNWAGSETITFRATDPTSLFDEDQAVFTIQAAPVVTGIPDQTIQLEQSFTTFDLDDYVTDPDHNDNQLNWTTSGDNDFTVNINASTHVVTIVPKLSNWAGSNTVTFIATDPTGLSGQDVALFRIMARPMVSNIPNQSIEKGQVFTSFDLDDYVTDLDNSQSQITWTDSGGTNLSININPTSHIVTVSIIDTNWTGSETIYFKATDPDGLYGHDDVVFAINAPGNNAPEFISEPLESAITGEFYSYHVIASDSDGDSLVFSLINGTPVFLNVVRNDSSNAISAFISGVPPLGSDGEYHVVILVSDNEGGTAEQRYNLTVSSSPLEKIDEIKAYPTPYVQSKSPANFITFSSIPVNSQLILYNLIGEPVFNTKVDNQPYTWYIKNNAGLDVQSGVYFYYVKEGSKILSSGKIVIVR